VHLKQQWSKEHSAGISATSATGAPSTWWADDVYSNVRLDDRVRLRVIVGVIEHGHKELVAVEDGYRDFEARWSAPNSLIAHRVRSFCRWPIRGATSPRKRTSTAYCASMSNSLTAASPAYPPPSSRVRSGDGAESAVELGITYLVATVKVTFFYL